MTKKTKIKVGAEDLAAYFHLNQQKETPNFLFLHGAGRSSSSRTNYLTERLANQGISSISLDFSGHGGSTGHLLGSSLEKRVAESLAALPFLAKKEGISICGSSMGGYVALRLLQELECVSTLILFCPAVYDGKAYNVPFGEEFSCILRQKESWRNTDVLASLRQFTGKLLLFIGENDDVIPDGVIDLIDNNAINTAEKKIIRFPECPHRIHEWLAERPDLADAVVGEIVG